MGDPCSKDHRLACELVDWERDAHDGVPTSAYAPAYAPQPETTPCRLVDRCLDLDTSPPIPNPMRKTQLAAAKRLEKEMKLAGNKTQKEKKNAAAKGKKKEKKQKKEKKENQEKKPRKPNQGPLTEVMKEYIKGRRQADGLSYHDALKALGTSSERAEIVSTMSLSEQKRRRYT